MPATYPLDTNIHSDCKQEPKKIQETKEILSCVIYVLTQEGDSKSYRLLINYIKNLDRIISIGALEFISDILSTFAEMDNKI